ncbi:MAG TPA: Ldh family oxidoreductase [Phycisphaerae bacterium]|nr:Ldh family oxidoreductase [Phycisphaerae bacterium]
MRRIPMQDLIDFGERLLIAKGVARPDARYLAEIAVQSEAFGVTTHGLVQFTHFDSQIGKSIDPAREPKVVRDIGASALIDGQGTFGQLAVRLGKQLAADKARQHGIAMIAIRRTSWIAALGIHLISLARDGFAAQIWAQSSQCQDSAPIGGIDARVSTNPIALAFPTDGDPVVADFSTSAISMGAVSRMAKAGRRAEHPIFMDNQGRLTNDPGVVRPDGAILFMGGEQSGHKGYALSLWCEAMTALAGGDCNNPDAPQAQSFTLIVIDPEAFAGREYYAQEMKRFVGWLRSSRLRPGTSEIRLPGQRGFRLLHQARKEGVPVDDAALEQLNRLAAENGVDAVTV